MVRELADCIATILMYAGEPIAPSKMRVFNMDPALYEWVQAHVTRALAFLDWRSKMYAPLPTALPEGEPHEVPTLPAGDDLRRVP